MQDEDTPDIEIDVADTNAFAAWEAIPADVRAALAAVHPAPEEE